MVLVAVTGPAPHTGSEDINWTPNSLSSILN